MQLLIPYALVDKPGCAQALPTLQLPGLEQLLRRMTLTLTDKGSGHDLSTPHERALLRAFGIVALDGRAPLAALAQAHCGAGAQPHACAWITPAHWQVGADRILMLDPAALQLQEVESRALLQAMAPYFSQDGLELRYLAPGRWLASGEPLATLASASLDRVIGADVSPWMPASPGLRRLQNEMQMLLYTHPVNEARIARGLAGVNSFWISGSGRLEAVLQPVPPPTIEDALRTPALAEDWTSWSRAWSRIDQTACRDLLAELRAGRPAQLTLCSARNALVFESDASGWMNRLQRRFQRISLHNLAHQL